MLACNRMMIVQFRPIVRSVIVFECVDRSIGQRVNVSGLSCVSNKVLGCWDSHTFIYDPIHHQESSVYAALV